MSGDIFCFLKYNKNITITIHFKQYFHSFIQSAMFTGRVARQINRLYVVRMTVKLALVVYVRRPRFVRSLVMNNCADSDSYPVAFRRRKRGDAEDFGKEMRGAQRVWCGLVSLCQVLSSALLERFWHFVGRRDSVSRVYKIFFLSHVSICEFIETYTLELTCCCCVI